MTRHTISAGATLALLLNRCTPESRRANDASSIDTTTIDVPGLDDTQTDGTAEQVEDDSAAHDGSVIDASIDVAYLLDVPRGDGGVEPIFTYSDLHAVSVFTPNLFYPATFVTTSDGSLWGWGANQGGYFQPYPEDQSPIPISAINIRLRPQRVGGISEVREMTAYNNGLCALAGVVPVGRIYCWGYAVYRGTGIAHREPWDLWRYPRQMGDIADVRKFAQDATCMWADRGMWSYALYNSEWYFFDLTNRVSPPRTVIDAVDGVTWYEGGVLATDFATSYATRDFQPQDGIVMIAGYYGYACVLLDSGRVRCFGHNQAGQTGNGFDGSEQMCGTPSLADGGTAPAPQGPCVSRLTEIPGLADVVKISLMYDTSCALKRDGTVWCWGWDPPMPNGMSMLGYGGVPNEFCVPPGHPESAIPCRKHPTQVVGITDAVDLSLGPGHACVVRRGGSVACWGYNFNGQLGDWTLTDRATPVTVRWH